MRVSGRYISAIHSDDHPKGRKSTIIFAGAPKPRRVIVLGAGASRHAGYPLAAPMGHCLAAWISTLPADSEHHWCLQELTRTYGPLDNFETILADLMTCLPGSPAESLGVVSRPLVLSGLKEAIRGYFNTIRSKPTPLYDRLAALVQPGDTIITFNYDLGIERALHDASKWHVSTGYGVIIGEPHNTAVSVLKLHGSINWRALLFGGISSGYFASSNSLGNRPVLFFKPDLEYLGYPTFVDPLCTGPQVARSTLPAMIMPALPKQFFFSSTYGEEWRPFWDGLWRQAETVLRTADEMAIIGYSLPTADERARALLLETANPTARLSVCCRDNTTAIEQLFRAHGFTNIIVGTPMFEDYLDTAERSESQRPPLPKSFRPGLVARETRRALIVPTG